eukprot:jgi/Chrzof1/1174/Cz01g43140.t1
MQAFETLAHPEYGIMMIDYRIVDCNTHEVMPAPVITDAIYKDMPGVGWSWFHYGYAGQNYAVSAKGEGVNGSAAACDVIKPKGGMTFSCRKCGMAEGFQPFKGISSIDFEIRSNDHPGQAPPLALIVGNLDTGVFCNTHVDLSSLTPAATGTSGWLKFSIPIETFNCPNLEQVNQIDFSTNPSNTGNTDFCIDELYLVRPGSQQTIQSAG